MRQLKSWLRRPLQGLAGHPGVQPRSCRISALWSF